MSTSCEDRTAQPVLVSTWSFGLRGHAMAWPALSDGGSSLDAVARVCSVIEAAEDVNSVGFGGLPDRDGTVNVEGAVMLHPARCGAVAGLSRFLPATAIARSVMERTDHVLIAGAGADRFAAAAGFEEQPLLSFDAATRWHEWRRRGGDRHAWTPPMPIDHGSGDLFGHDTICALAIDVDSVLAGASSTSGLPFRHPGRVGDAPIIGHGIYVDPDTGGAVATGHGELVSGICGSFLAVERMRLGDAPLEALRHVMHRMQSKYALRDEHQVGMIAVRADGQWASASLRPAFRVSVTTAERNEVVEPQLVVGR